MASLGAGVLDIPNGRTLAAFVFAVALVAMALVAAAVGLRYRPRHPDAGPETTMPPEGGPGVANLLTNDLEVDDDAAVAAVLELARLGAVEIGTFGNDREVLFVRRRERVPAEGPLRHVFAFIDSQPRLEEGLPLEALRDAHAGADDDHGAWWKTFRRLVVQEATSLGLVARRFPAGLVRGLQGACGGIVVLAMILVGEEEDAPRGTGATGWSIAALIGAACLAMAALSRLDGDALRYTEQGRELAGRWLGFRRGAEESVTLVEAAPSAVTVLGDALVGATAVGSARETERRLQLAVGNGSAVWWVHGGRWHHTRVRYPGGSQGQSPGSLIGSSLVPIAQLGAVAGLIGFAVSLIWRSLDDTERATAWNRTVEWVRDHASIAALRDDPSSVAIAVSAVVAIVFALIAGTALLVAISKLLRGLVDLVLRRTEHGIVIVRRGEWFAVARPGDEVVTAYRVLRFRRRPVRGEIVVGQEVAVRSTLLARYVIEISPRVKGAP